MSIVVISHNQLYVFSAFQSRHKPTTHHHTDVNVLTKPYKWVHVIYLWINEYWICWDVSKLNIINSQPQIYTSKCEHLNRVEFEELLVCFSGTSNGFCVSHFLFFSFVFSLLILPFSFFSKTFLIAYQINSTGFDKNYLSSDECSISIDK